MKTLFILATINLLILGNLSAQDTIVHKNGNIFLVDILHVDDDVVEYKLWNKKNERIFQLDKFSIFSISKKNQEEKVLYSYDPNIGNIYEVDEMRLYIKGEQDAQQNYSSPPATIAAILGGVAGGYVLGQGNILGITAPIIVPALISITGARVKPHTVRDIDYIYLHPYRQGYKRVAKKKKYLNALLTSTVSMLGATIISAAFID